MIERVHEGLGRVDVAQSGEIELHGRFGRAGETPRDALSRVFTA